MFLYPITIVLILLNIVPDKFASKLAFRAVVIVTFIFSIPDFLGFIIPRENLTGIQSIVPLAEFGLGVACAFGFCFVEFKEEIGLILQI
jgi:LIVCS family branched-chain amino acid:cation transporter